MYYVQLHDNILFVLKINSSKRALPLSLFFRRLLIIKGKMYVQTSNKFASKLRQDWSRLELTRISRSTRRIELVTWRDSGYSANLKKEGGKKRGEGLSLIDFARYNGGGHVIGSAWFSTLQEEWGIRSGWSWINLLEEKGRKKFHEWRGFKIRTRRFIDSICTATNIHPESERRLALYNERNWDRIRSNDQGHSVSHDDLHHRFRSSVRVRNFRYETGLLASPIFRSARVSNLKSSRIFNLPPPPSPYLRGEVERNARIV